MTGGWKIELENASGRQLLAIGGSGFGRGDDPPQAIFRPSLAATLHALRESGPRAVTVTVAVQRCPAEARLRGPGLRPAERPGARGAGTTGMTGSRDGGEQGRR